LTGWGKNDQGWAGITGPSLLMIYIIGSDLDRNGDTYICIKHATEKNHVHMDNSITIH
jgi:hypothetical protein